MKFFISIFFLLTNLVLLAQTKLTGVVVNESGKPIPFAAIHISSSDRQIRDSTFSDQNGQFAFAINKNVTLLLKTSAVGYKGETREIAFNTSKNAPLKITLYADVIHLEEVSITSSKNVFEQQADRLVVNVNQIPSASGLSIFELLKRIPGLLVSDDKIALAGTGSATILINGRESRYDNVSQALKGLNAANVEKVEIISHPGANYEAAGGSIINIITKRKKADGWSGSLNMLGGTGIYNKRRDKVDRNFNTISPSITLNYSTDKVSLYGYYSYFYSNVFDHKAFERTIDSISFYQHSYTPWHANNHLVTFGGDIYLTKRNTIRVGLSTLNRAISKESNNVTDELFANSGAKISSFSSLIDLNEKQQNTTVTVGWQLDVDTVGGKLSADVEYSTFKINSTGEYDNVLDMGEHYVNHQSIRNPVELFVAKTDFKRSVFADYALAIGAKTSYATIDNGLRFWRNGVIDSETSTDFAYKENINAAYLSLERRFKFAEVKLGVRAEQTRATGNEKGTEVLDRDYLQLFPSLFIKKDISKKFGTVFQYSKRVNRPSYQQQNPFIRYIDSLTYTKGNPLLQPETANQYQLALTFRNQPFFMLSYNNRKDVIFQNAPQQIGNITYTMPDNLGRYENFSAQLNLPIRFIPNTEGYISNQIMSNRYRAHYLNGVFDQQRWNVLSFLQLAYRFDRKWVFEASGYYISTSLNEFALIESKGSLNLSLQRTVLGGKGKINLNANDILYTDKTRARIHYQDIDITLRQRIESRNFRLSFTYNFGGKDGKTPRKEVEKSEEYNRVKTD
ncbi:outer membrane beta-barrel family protein [Olivibacter ginsenosidimutans]|uniref:Outer membrane beta-barrel family protein n=1 Tax=Olivibacter ginsenosidimutans TaxID=1176537 RepID=A0ABP9AGC2_9SPHI